jgi:TPR repeat protein
MKEFYRSRRLAARIAVLAAVAGIGSALRAQDPVDSLDTLRERAGAGEEEAQFKIGEAFYYGRGAERDIGEAVKWVIAAAEQGHLSARTWLGDLHMTGLVVSYDPETAFRLYLEGAVKNHVAACYAVATCYRYGRGVEANREKARTWYERAVQIGEEEGTQLDSISATRVGFCYRDGVGARRNVRRAARWLLEGARGNSAEALYQLAQLYAFGIGVPPNSAKARTLYQKSAAAGSAQACLALARVHTEVAGNGNVPDTATEWARRAFEILEERAGLGSVEDATDLYVLYTESPHLQRNAVTAAVWLKLAVEKGYPRALTLEGRRYVEGREVPRDMERALERLNAAAEKRQAEAHYVLFQLYHSGNGVPRDAEKALQFLKSASELGSISAMRLLADWYASQEDLPHAAETANYWYGEAVEGYTLLAERGNVEAMSVLITLYGRGRGVERDTQRVYYWLLRAAESGWVNAQFMMANAYEKGLDIEPDEREALTWYRRAADAGHIPSILGLGAVYEQGLLGEDRNAETAEEWFRIAFDLTREQAEQGDAAAAYMVATFYVEGIGVDMNLEQGLAWLHTAGDNGHVLAQLELGSAYSTGDGVVQDVPAAMEWMRKAAEQGNAEAQYIIGKAYDLGEVLETDYIEAYTWMTLSAAQGFEPARMLLEEMKVTLSPDETDIATARALEKIEKTQAWPGESEETAEPPAPR